MAEQRAYIAAKTDGGMEIVDFMLNWARDESLSNAERAEAYRWLQDHGIGKAADRHEVEVFDHRDDAGADLDRMLESMPEAERLEWLRQYEALHARLVDAPQLNPAPAEVLDAEVVEGE